MDIALAAALLAVLLLAPGCAAAGREGRPPAPGERLPEVRGPGTAPSDDAASAADARLYFSVRGQSAPSLSPGGDRIAWMESVTGSPQAWRADRPLGWPVQVTHFADRATGVRWAPGGEALLVSGDLGGDERDDLLLVRPDGSRPVVLARGSGGRNEAGGFTPDGAALVFASTRRHPAHHDLWIAETATGEARPLFESDDMNAAGDVSPDGSRVIHTRSHGSFETELAVVDLATGERTRLLPDAPPARYLDARWSADGRSLLCVSDLGRDFLAIQRIPLDGGAPEVVAAAEGDVEEFDYSPATGWMAWTENDRGRSRLLAWNPGAGGRPVILLEGGRAGSGPVFAGGAAVLAVAWGSATRPSSLLRFDLRGAHPTGEEMTRPDFAGLDASAFVEPEERRFPSFDGTEISGFLYRPRGGSGSCVVLVHGGPEGQYRPGFDPLVQLLVARGHAVFAPNVRGSTGYGRAFAKLDDGTRRMDSVRDLEAVHDHLVATGVAPADRIAVMGGSYGGYMVLMAVTHQPERWAAGVDVVGISHLGTFLRNTGAYRRRHRAAEYGDPVECADFHEETAPVNHADRIRAPLFIIQGRNDPRVPASETEQIAAAARANGVAVEVLMYEDEGHGLSKLRNRVEAYGRVADFLTAILNPTRIGGGGGGGGAAPPRARGAPPPPPPPRQSGSGSVWRSLDGRHRPPAANLRTA